MNQTEAIYRLEDAGLLTRKQAEAYVLREFEGLSRLWAADAIGVSPNTLDSRLSTARKKLEAAEATTEAVEAMHGFEPVYEERDPADECDECGAALQSFVPVDGKQLCPSCGGVE
jgi:predicted DNA-binding protein (UPF0251 family)